MQWLIATDLDGTLLDDSYDLVAAAGALDLIGTRGNEIALASSKTLAEMRELADLCARPPVLIFENGAGIAWPGRLWRTGDSDGARHSFHIQLQGEGYAQLRAMLRTLRHRSGLRFLGFADMSPREIAQRTGLTERAAALAQKRQASEPVRWLDSPEALTRFRQALAAHGYRLVEGGRFHHVMPRTDKACAVARVTRRVAELQGVRIRVLACGDSANDLDMLARADAAVVFPRSDGRELQPEARRSARDGGPLRVLHAAAAGPGHWSRAVSDLLRQFEAEEATAARGPTPGAEPT